MTQTQMVPTYVPPTQELAGTDLPANGTARNATAVRSIPPDVPHLNAYSSGSQMLTIEQVVERVQSDDKGKWDIVLPRSEVLMRNGRLIFPDAKAYECENGLVPSPWAMGQLCRRLSIPTSYFRRCPAFLMDVQFNHWSATR